MSPSAGARLEVEGLVASALNHGRVLAGQIGPRPAGSPAEVQAQEYVAQHMTQRGYAIQRQEVPFAPPVFEPLYALAGLLLIASGWSIDRLPWLGVFMPLLFVAMPQIARWRIRNRRRTARTQNLYAWKEPLTPAKRTLVINAHLDSAPAIALQNETLRRIYSRTLDIVQRAAIFIAALAALKILGMSVPSWLLTLGGAAATLAGGWLAAVECTNQLARPIHCSPGAVDNASGVAVVLALAEYFAVHPAAHTRLGFVFTGAEETGLHGAEAFAGLLRAEHPQAQVICLDMVGAGNRLRYVTSDGTLFPLHTSPALNEAIRAVAQGAAGLRNTHKSGDSAAYLRAGLAATELQTSGSRPAELAYHTRFDTTELLQRETLAMTIRTMLKVIQYGDQI